jgi:hypothetical protein
MTGGRRAEAKQALRRRSQDDPYVPLLKTTSENLDGSKAWRDNATQVLEKGLAALCLIYVELQAINTKLGVQPPMLGMATQASAYKGYEEGSMNRIAAHRRTSTRRRGDG